MSIIDQEAEVEASLAKARDVHMRINAVYDSPSDVLVAQTHWDKINGVLFRKDCVIAIAPLVYAWNEKRFTFTIILHGGFSITVRSPDEVTDSSKPDQGIIDLYSECVNKYAS